MSRRDRSRPRTPAAAIAALSLLAFVLAAAGASSARDHRAPRIVSATLEDADRDSRADRLRLTYSEPVRHTKDADGTYPFAIAGLKIQSVGAATGRVVVVSLVEADTPAAPAVRYLKTTKQPIEDRAGNQAAVQAFTRVTANLAATPPPPPPPPPTTPPPNADRDGDGFADAQDCAPGDAAVNPKAADPPDLAFVDANCDGIDGDEKGAVFVSPQGKDANAGTKAAPLRSVQAAIVQASQQKKDVFVAAGFYERIEVADAVGVYGGYRADTWARANAQVTAITGAPEGILAVHATGVVLQHLTVAGTGNGRSGGSAYGIRIVGGSKLTLQRVLVSAGGGVGGAPGITGATGADGSQGGHGTLGECDGKDPGRGGRGGASPAGRIGGRGGDGGIGDHIGDTGALGDIGTPGGVGGKGSGTPVSPGRRGVDGTNGSKGAEGTRGVGGTDSTAGAGLTWEGQSGKAGTPGAPGDGGGGGGGGGGQGGALVYDGTGNGGGGGGGGAAGGGGGTGGGAGGGSFGIYLYDSTVTVSQGSTVTATRGGAGGNGGQGGAGGTGGDPGLGAVTCLRQIGAGGHGGVGGTGGLGGGGGGGAGGPSVGIFKAGASTALVAGSTVTAGSPGAGGQAGFGGPRSARPHPGRPASRRRSIRPDETGGAPRCYGSGARPPSGPERARGLPRGPILVHHPIGMWIRVVAAFGVGVAALAGSLAFFSLRVVTGHRVCTFGYPGCDEIHGHPGWASVVAVVIAVVGVGIAAAIFIVRHPRLPKAAYLIAFALTLWFATFWASGTFISWLYEGETSECWKAECGRYAEFVDDHGNLSVILLGVVAFAPSAFFLWTTRGRFAEDPYY